MGEVRKLGLMRGGSKGLEDLMVRVPPSKHKQEREREREIHFRPLRMGMHREFFFWGGTHEMQD